MLWVCPSCSLGRTVLSSVPANLFALWPVPARFSCMLLDSVLEKQLSPKPLIPLGSLGGRQRRGNGHGPHPAGGGFTFDLLSPGRPRSAVPQVMGSPPGSRAGALRTLPPGEPAPFRVEARARSLLPEAPLAYPSSGLRRAVPPPLSCRHTLRFWNAAFFDAVHCERRKRSPTTR